MNSPADGAEVVVRATCFGGRVAVNANGPGALSLAREAIEELHEVDAALSRFRPGSELCRLNRDAREAVPASPLMLEMVEAIAFAGELSGGLVDGSLLEPLERAGYVESIDTESPSPPSEPPAVGPARVPALPAEGWRAIEADRAGGVIRRSPGVRIDSGGLGKGLAADRVARLLRDAPAFCVDCAGDMAIGGAAGVPRAVNVEHPFTGEVVHSLQVERGGVATSGTTRRSWEGEDGRPRHHLIDPGRGVPAFTGVVQVTALAPTALEAEVLAKAALLSGPGGARRWLPYGGVIVRDDGSAEAFDDAAATAAQAA